MTDGPPCIGDRVVLTRSAQGGTYREVWQRRRDHSSLVIDVHGSEVHCLLMLRDDDGRLVDRHDPWSASAEDLRVVGRASYADLRPLADRAAALEVLRGSTVALDFDGPVHSYRRGWTGYVAEDPPTPGAREFVTLLLEAGAKVVIHTSRADSPAGKEGVRRYLLKHGFPELPVSYSKVPAAAYIDDRAVGFDPHRGYDDVLLADLLRQCRTRHHGEAWEAERFEADRRLDTESSASRQHYIDTGDYLPLDAGG